MTTGYVTCNKIYYARNGQSNTVNEMQIVAFLVEYIAIFFNMNIFLL